ncbi:uncharacterized protein LOC127085697 [Lathyrus oleraceus]|uniref:Uncharacterized protein n=1 Tax=Pisum sativum TaxID=3888 RepID=A0A9D5AGD1_PEA|nr:uncharacterized protein LOC127085697 [Pisum sativum]KAI5410662.1 hypothetical protein KIW84_055979 [Pisum sativum]
MGKWNHRPRFFSRRRSPDRPSVFYDIKAPLPDFRHDGIPLWEKKYCTLSGCVAWQKIVDSKELIYCHQNVLDWKDSGAEEAFQNAKKRYWAKIKNLPCDISLPDLDAYIEHVDWNPCIDPELIKEIDNAHFTIPDEEEQDEEEQENALNNKRTKISADGEDPWESAAKSLGRTVENNKVQGQNQGDYHDNSENAVTTNNPWQSNFFHGNQRLTDNAWEGGHDKSSGWKEGRDHSNQCGYWNSGCSPKNKGWGNARDSSWCQQQPNNLANIGNSWEHNSSKQNVIPMNTGWGNSGTNVSRWKQQEKAYVSSDSQFRRNNGGGWTGGNQNYQMREGSNRHNSGYNGSQFQRGDSQTGHYWKREQSRKRDFRAR